MSVKENCDQDVFVEVSNRDVWNKLCEIEKKFDETINGNGKKGIKEILAEHGSSLKFQWSVLFVVLGGVIGLAFKVLLP